MSLRQSELELWAASGAMMLTGRPDGPPQAAPGRPASTAADALDRIRAAHPGVALPDVGVLSERAAAAGLTRAAPWSCGGAFRVLPTADGYLGLSLPRADDTLMLPALVSGYVDEPWLAVERWARQTPTSDAVARARMLGLACSPVGGPAPAAREAAVVRTLGPHQIAERPLVLDFTSLWAGPLCGHLLTLCGADVVKVESTARLDGARRGPRAFYDLLHAGQRSVTVDFESHADLHRLRELVSRADLVLEASRARALRRLGLIAEDVVSVGTSWLSITAYGRDQDVIGFGDDVAAGAGLITKDLHPCGDALADPLSGVVAAAYAVEALARPEAVLVDVSMHDVAAEAAAGEHEPHQVICYGGSWWVEGDAGRFQVAAPRIRAATGRAPVAGQHNRELLR